MVDVKLYLGDCLNVLPMLEAGSVDAVITDPPYGEAQGLLNDSNPRQAAFFLQNMLKRITLPRMSHACVFWTMRSLDLCIDAVREAGLQYQRTLTMYLPSGQARPYLGWLPRIQPIVVAQHNLPLPASETHYYLATYLTQAMEKAEYSRSALAKILRCNSRLIMKWTRQNDPAWCLPTPRFYTKLKTLLDLDEQFDFMLTRESPKRKKRRMFEYKHDCYIVKNRSTAQHGHPCSKPLIVLKHLVKTIADVGDTVLDPCMGSGTTGVACVMTGRNFIGIEIDEGYFNIAKARIAKAQTEMVQLELST